MPRPPLAREKVLDAFQTILIEEGERAATLDATAKAAGVSKGGLLYHFASKDELVAGLLERLDALAADDLDLMTAAQNGPVDYYIRNSLLEDSAFDRALIAAARIAQGGDLDASAALRSIRESWADCLRPHVHDDAALDLVMLIGDGLYYNNVLDAVQGGLAGPTPRGAQLEQLIALALRASR
ncbi:TetR/AcrR family transcriptional regulator [uncultured Microbacterium sp.]|uniref:TetR/AcrR family transcriptional regulator n=1 Tax=uncultured Microbacterium sp. TaxID=191216 RepID=UPI002617FC0A|nr:TetR/AcrR family transcriptional regulator [uncultured Microbacterium sp.]